MNSADELDALDKRFDDDYVQNVAKMSNGRIGGEAKRVLHIMRDPIMSHHSQDLPDKMIDGCILKAANKIYDELTPGTTPVIAEALGVNSSELSPLHLTIVVETEMAGIMIHTYKVKSYSEYIQKKGFEDFIAFILAVGNNLIKQLPKNV